MPVGPDPLQREAEPNACQQPVVLCRGGLAAELAVDPLHFAGLSPNPVEESSLDQEIVRAVIVGRHAPLVAPPQARAAPVRLELCGLLVRGAGRVTARECDRLTASCCFDEKLGGSALRVDRDVEDSEVDRLN